MRIELNKFIHLFSKYLSCHYKPRILSSGLDMDAVLSLMELMHQSQESVIDIKGLALRIHGLSVMLDLFTT